MDHFPVDLTDESIGTLVQNEFEASDRHHLLKARHLGATKYDNQEDDRVGGHKKWRHRQFVRHRQEIETKQRERIVSKQNAEVEAEKRRQLLEEIKLEELKRLQEVGRQAEVRASEAAMLGLASVDEVTLLRQRLAAAAYTDGGVNWEKLFHHFDRDNSKGLTFDEFSRSLRREARIGEVDEEVEEIVLGAEGGSASTSSTLLRIDDAALRKLFDAVDTSGNGLLELDEFERWLEYADDTWQKEQDEIRRLAAIERMKARKLTPEEEAAQEYKEREPFVITEYSASDTMYTKSDHQVHYGPVDELKIWYHRPSSVHLGEAEDRYDDGQQEKRSTPETTSIRVSPAKKKKWVAKKKKKKKKTKNKQQQQRISRGSTRESSRSHSRSHSRSQSRSPSRGQSRGQSRGLAHNNDTVSYDDGDFIWFKRKQQARIRLDRWATASKYLAKESLQRSLRKEEKIWDGATSKSHRFNLTNARITRMHRGYPVHTTMCAIEIQRAWRCAWMRICKNAASCLQKRWRDHLWCIAVIRKSLLKIEQRLTRGSLLAWSDHVEKRKKGRNFLRKHMAGLRDKMFISWSKHAKYDAGERERKRVKATAKYLKRRLYICFHGLANWQKKMTKTRDMLRKRLEGIKGETFYTWIEAINDNKSQRKWVVNIQSWFRCLKISITRRILHRNLRNRSAIVLQALWRGVRVRRRIAATTIQCMYRTWKAWVVTFEVEDHYRNHEKIRQIVEAGSVQRAFRIDAPRVVGAWLGRPEYMAVQRNFQTTNASKRERMRKNILRNLANHLHESYYLAGIQRERKRAGAKWALEHSVDIACALFDPMLEGKFLCIHMRSVLCQLLGPEKRKVGKDNLTGEKESLKLATSLDRDNTGYVPTERFKQWYVQNVGLQTGRHLIESKLTTKEEEKSDKPTQPILKKKKSMFAKMVGSSEGASTVHPTNSPGTTMRLPAAEAAFFEAGKWLIRDHASEKFRTSGVAVGREPEADRHQVANHDEYLHHSFEFKFLHHSHHHQSLPEMSELYRTTMPRHVAPDALHRHTFGTLREMNKFAIKIQEQDPQALAELDHDPRPQEGSTVLMTYQWMLMDGAIQKQLRKELLNIDNEAGRKLNKDTLDNPDNMLLDSLRGREKGNSAAERKARYRLMAANIAAENERKRLEMDAMLEALGDPGKHHTLEDHTKPVRFMLQSFEPAHEYRAKWKNVDGRIGRNGKKMKVYKGTCFASDKNKQGMCAITIQVPRVGTYRVDIEQRFGYMSRHEKKILDAAVSDGVVNSKTATALSSTNSKNSKKRPSSPAAKVLHKVGVALETAEEGTGKCVHRLRQVVQRSKWKTVAGSPKYIVAKFSIAGRRVAAKMQNEKPDDVAEQEDFDDDQNDQNDQDDEVNKLLIKRTASMPAGVGDFNNLGGELKMPARTKVHILAKARRNSATRKTVVEIALPPYWEMLYDDAQGSHYYYNSETEETSWERPKE